MTKGGPFPIYARRLAAAAALAALPCIAVGPVWANDSTAELGTGGLRLARSDVVSMESERLYISSEEIAVEYEFLNGSKEDVETIVAFPMPDIPGEPDLNISIPVEASDNFLGFEVTVDKMPVTPTLEQRALAGGLDVTEVLLKAGVPLFPYGDATDAALKALPPRTLKDFQTRGIVTVQQWDEGKGMEDHAVPIWTLKSAYWWRTVFSAGKTVTVEHRYKPSVGSTAGSVFSPTTTEAELAELGYIDRYCMEKDFIESAKRKAESGLFESRIEYVLTTGANWAGPIKSFHLTVDKGAPNALVSFCGEGVEKTGETTFEMEKTDFYPERDLHVLVLMPADN